MRRSMRLQATQRLQHLRMCHLLFLVHFHETDVKKQQVLVCQLRCDD